VLVALNLADECFRARQQESSVGGTLNERALRLERLLDEALGAQDSVNIRQMSA
jgi:hypothetical protein